MERIQFDNNRLLLVGSVDENPELLPDGPFAIMVPAFGPAERAKVLTMTPTLIEKGCTQFSCVGPESAELEDAIDYIIEDRGDDDEFSILTTSHIDDPDVGFYFVILAGGGSPVLVALVAEHPPLIAILYEALATR